MVQDGRPARKSAHKKGPERGVPFSEMRAKAMWASRTSSWGGWGGTRLRHLDTSPHWWRRWAWRGWCRSRVVPEVVASTSSMPSKLNRSFLASSYWRQASHLIAINALIFGSCRDQTVLKFHRFIQTPVETEYSANLSYERLDLKMI